MSAKKYPEFIARIVFGAIVSGLSLGIAACSVTPGTDVQEPGTPEETPTDLTAPTQESPEQPGEGTAGYALELNAEFRDTYAGIEISIPESWVVDAVIDGQSAAFQSYPTDKYVGGEPLEPGDTKCNLTIHPPGISASSILDQIVSNPEYATVANETMEIASGLRGQRLELEGCWWASRVLVLEVNDRAVVFSCFGDHAPFDAIAQTILGFEPDSSGQSSAEESKDYTDSVTGVTVTIPANWVVSAIFPGQRATLHGASPNGEPPGGGETSCELFLRNDIGSSEFAEQMRNNDAITIHRDEEILLASGLAATRIEMESLERSMVFITEINGVTVLLTCSGDFSMAEMVADTLRGPD